MKAIYPLLIFTGLLAVGTGLILSGTGCDEIQAPCDIQETKKGDAYLELKYLQSWSAENGYATLRFTYPDRTIFFVCTDRTVTYQATLEKFQSSTVFMVSPQARLIWQFPAPGNGDAVLMGGGSFEQLFRVGINSETLYTDRITLAYSEGGVGGYFIPGLEIKIPTLGNRSDDFNFVYFNFSVVVKYQVDYRLSY